MAFKKIGSMLPDGSPVLKKLVVANSVTITEVDSVKAASGFAALGTAGALVLGHVDAIVTNLGVGLLTTGAVGAEMGSFSGTFATASDNQTVAMVSVLVDVSKYSMYSATPDAAIGTTTGSNLIGYHTDIASEDTPDEDTATAATAQYAIWGTEVGASSKGVYSIYESQVFGV